MLPRARASDAVTVEPREVVFMALRSLAPTCRDILRGYRRGPTQVAPSPLLRSGAPAMGLRYLGRARAAQDPEAEIRSRLARREGHAAAVGRGVHAGV